MAVTVVTKENFAQEVLQSDKPVLIDFWASWCGPCRMLAPTIEKLGEEFEGKAVVGKVDVDENQNLAGKFGVMSIPTVIVFKNGKEVARKVGVQPAPVYKDLLNSNL